MERFWGDFPGGSVVKTSPSNAGGGQGAMIPHTSQPKSQNIQQKQHCNKFNKDLKNGLHKKKNVSFSFFTLSPLALAMLGNDVDVGVVVWGR